MNKHYSGREYESETCTPVFFLLLVLMEQQHTYVSGRRPQLTDSCQDKLAGNVGFKPENSKSKSHDLIHLTTTSHNFKNIYPLICHVKAAEQITTNKYLGSTWHTCLHHLRSSWTNQVHRFTWHCKETVDNLYPSFGLMEWLLRKWTLSETI